MGFCKGLAKSFVVGVCSITTLLGLAIIGICSYVLVKFKDLEALSVTKTGAGIGIGVGVFILLLSLAGCFGALKQNKCLLIIYLFFTTVLLIVQIVGGIFIYKFADNFIAFGDTMSSSTSTSTNEISSKPEQVVSDFFLGTYEGCCATYPGVDVGKFYSCPKCPFSAGVTQCYWNGCAPGAVVTPPAAPTDCDATSQCTVNPLVSEIGDTNFQGFCQGLEKLPTKDGTNLVGATACTSLTTFSANVAQFGMDYGSPIAIGVIAVGVIQLLCVIFACALFIMNKAEFDEGDVI